MANIVLRSPTGKDIILSDGTVTTGGYLKYWTGSAWAVKTLKYWNGSVWVQKPLKYWDGSTWIQVQYNINVIGQQLFTASGSFTVPANVTQISAVTVGGGGGGAGGESGRDSGVKAVAVVVLLTEHSL
jgi:hypothetical protein